MSNEVTIDAVIEEFKQEVGEIEIVAQSSPLENQKNIEVS